MKATRVDVATADEVEPLHLIIRKTGIEVPVHRVRRVEAVPMNRPTVAIGIDPSLVGTGLAVIDGAGNIEYLAGWTNEDKVQARWPEVLGCYRILTPTWSGRLARILTMVEWVGKTIDRWSCSGHDVTVAIEGYAFNAKGAYATDLHELGGLLKQMCWQRGYPFRIYDPATIKIAWTGHGNANKPMMIAAAQRTFGVDLSRASEEAAGNLADAVCIAQLLRLELDVKAGRLAWEDLPVTVSAVFSRVTKADPEPLQTRPFEHCYLWEWPEPLPPTG